MSEQTGYRVCRCGTSVLRGVTDFGSHLDVETQSVTYLIDWTAGTPVPRLIQSRGYLLHTCPLREE